MAELATKKVEAEPRLVLRLAGGGSTSDCVLHHDIHF